MVVLNAPVRYTQLLQVIPRFFNLEILELELGVFAAMASDPITLYIGKFMSRVSRNLSRLRKIRLRSSPYLPSQSLERLEHLEDLHLNWSGQAHPGILPVSGAFHRGIVTIFPRLRATASQIAARAAVGESLLNSHRNLLHSLTHLTTLELAMPDVYDSAVLLLKPGDIGATALKRLGWSGGNLPAGVLLSLINSNPSLSEVCFEGIRLTSGTWEDVIMGLSRCAELKLIYVGGFEDCCTREAGYTPLHRSDCWVIHRNRGHLHLGLVGGLTTHRWQDVHCYADLIRQILRRTGKKWWPRAHWVFERYLNFKPVKDILEGRASLGDTFEAQSWVTAQSTRNGPSPYNRHKTCAAKEGIRRGRSRSVENPGSHLSCWEAARGGCAEQEMGPLQIDPSGYHHGLCRGRIASLWA